MGPESPSGGGLLVADGDLADGSGLLGPHREAGARVEDVVVASL